MSENPLRIFGRYYDQIYLKKKDYKAEAQIIRKIISQFEKKPSERLLDAGCGTGEHLKYLSQNFQCKGIDINKDMIETARTKVPRAEFEIASMIDFKVSERFDVVICLFSSIGYVQNLRNLVLTLRNFYDHLDTGGLAIVEPWVFRKDFLKGKISIDTYEEETSKLVRMTTSKLTKSEWLVFMHYLIGTDGEIKYVHETHRMLAADYDDYMRAFRLAQYGEIKFLKDSLWMGSRGLFVAAK